jgi:hypothetical protein
VCINTNDIDKVSLRGVERRSNLMQRRDYRALWARNDCNDYYVVCINLNQLSIMIKYFYWDFAMVLFEVGLHLVDTFRQQLKMAYTTNVHLATTTLVTNFG